MAALALAVAALAAGAVAGSGRRVARRAAELEQLKAKVAQATRMLAREGIIAASGHVSARIPGTDRVVIGPGDVTRDILTADDIITVDLNSKKLDGKTREPLETEIHTGIYRARPDVMAVVHSHPVHSVVFSITKKPILPISVHGAIFADGVPTFDNGRPRQHARARRRPGARRSAAIARCCSRCTAPPLSALRVEEAFVASLQLEENAEKQLWAEATGKVEAMTAEEAARSVRQSFSRRASRSAGSTTRTSSGWRRAVVAMTERRSTSSSPPTASSRVKAWSMRLAMSASATRSAPTASSCRARGRPNASRSTTSWSSRSTARRSSRAAASRTPNGSFTRAVYEARADVRAVVHNHSPSVIPFGITGTPLRPVMHMCASMGAHVPLWDSRTAFGDTNLLVTNMAMARDLAARSAPVRSR